MSGSAEPCTAALPGAAWADAIQALALFAADPIGLGGISVRAGAGPVRDRYLAFLHASLSPDAPVRRVPPHIADDRLLGGLDLPATLRAGKPVAQPGLLAEADRGVVIVPMAERVDAALAVRLRAALDGGSIVLQRDGLSGIVAAQFGIVLLDEGCDPDERPPASLLDRMAFQVDLTQVSLREIRDTAPPSPAGTGWHPADDGPAATRAIETLCHVAAALGIASPRAPLLALRVARLVAERDGRRQIADTDIALAARLVLAPRATQMPSPPDMEAPAPPPPAEETADDDTSALPDQPLSDVVLEAALTALPPDLLARLAQTAGRGQVRTQGRAGQIKISLKRGRPIGTRQGEPRNGARLHLLETLKAAAPWQTLRGRSDRFQVRRDDFRIVRFRQRLGTTTVFAVDASGSAAMHRLAEAKGAVELLLADCYIRRDQVALIAFRGHDASLLLPPTASLLRAKRSLAALPGGGATPLAAGIEAATRLADTVRRTGRTPVVAMLTDARANIARDGSSSRPRAEADALAAAAAIGSSGLSALLVDTSPRPNPFARRLAEAMNARYVALPYVESSALSRAVRAASGA